MNCCINNPTYFVPYGKLFRYFSSTTILSNWKLSWKISFRNIVINWGDSPSVSSTLWHAMVNWIWRWRVIEWIECNLNHFWQWNSSNSSLIQWLFLSLHSHCAGEPSLLPLITQCISPDHAPSADPSEEIRKQGTGQVVNWYPPLSLLLFNQMKAPSCSLELVMSGHY